MHPMLEGMGQKGCDLGHRGFREVSRGRQGPVSSDVGPPPVSDVGAQGLLIRSMSARAGRPMSIAMAHSARRGQTTTREALAFVWKFGVFVCKKGLQGPMAAHPRGDPCVQQITGKKDWAFSRHLLNSMPSAKFSGVAKNFSQSSLTRRPWRKQ